MKIEMYPKHSLPQLHKDIQMPWNTVLQEMQLGSVRVGQYEEMQVLARLRKLPLLCARHCDKSLWLI